MSRQLIASQLKPCPERPRSMFLDNLRSVYSLSLRGPSLVENCLALIGQACNSWKRERYGSLASRCRWYVRPTAMTQTTCHGVSWRDVGGSFDLAVVGCRPEFAGWKTMLGWCLNC